MSYQSSISSKLLKSQLKNLEVYKNISEQQMWMTECHELEAKL